MNPHDGRPEMMEFIEAIETMIKSRCGVAAYSIQIGVNDGTATALFCIRDDLEHARNQVIDKMKEALEDAKRPKNAPLTNQTEQTDATPAKKLN